MDPASILIGLAICVIIAAILYFISVKSFQEKPFEEVLAEQQQFADNLLKGDKSNKDKDKKTKKNTVKKNKEKEKGRNQSNPATASQPIPFEEKPHVEFEPDAEIIPEEPIALNIEKERKKGDKKEKMKPILRNREHGSVDTFDPDVDSLNHFMEHPPKDDVELRIKDKDKSSKKGSKVAVEEKVSASEASIVEVAPVKEVAFAVARGTNINVGGAPTSIPVQPSQQPSTPKKQRKRNVKTDSIDAADGGEELLLQLGGTEKLLSALRQLPLTSSELQTMIEVLLNRQQEAAGTIESEWMERGGRLDPIGALRKQLGDKEKALQEELEEKQAYQNKLRTLGTEMTTERTRAAAARKQLEESLARQTTESQMLTVRLQQTTEQHAAEVNALRVAVQQAQKVSQTSEETLRQLQRLQDEKNQIETRLASAQQMQQEMGARVQQLEDFLMHKEQQLMEQSNQVAILACKLQESEQARNGQNHEVEREVAQLRETLQASEAQSLHTTRDARVRLEEMERTKQLLEDRITKVDRDLAMERSLAAQNEERIRQEVSRLCLENQALNLQLSNATQSRQEEDAKWASIQEKLQSERNQMAVKEVEAQKQMEQFRSEIQALNIQLSNSSQSRQDENVKLTTFQEQIKVERDQMSIKEAEIQKQLEQLRGETQSLSEQLNQANQSQNENRLQSEVTLKSKDEELETQKRKNNELRDKNYKAMDALAAAEKALIELKKSASIAKNVPSPAEINQAIGAGLQRVLPELSFDVSASPAVFADSLSTQVRISLERLQSEEQSKAQAQVLHYKTVLSQTEELLNRLQSRVEAEETSWKVKLVQMESDLMTVEQEKGFWMNQCQKQERQQLQEPTIDVASFDAQIKSLQEEKERLVQEMEKERQSAESLSSQAERYQEQLLQLQESTIDVALFHAQIKSLQEEKERLVKEMEKERQSAEALSSQTGRHQEQLQALESLLAEERRAVEHLRDQLDQAKAQLSATKVGSIGFMVGWAKSSAATVAAATARKNSLNSGNVSSEANPPSAQKEEVSTKSAPPATNGNGTNAESPSEEPKTMTKTNSNGQKSKNRKKKAVSHFES